MTDFIVKSGLQISGGSKLKSGTIAGNATLDLTSGNFFSHTPTADTTFVFNNPPASGKVDGFALKITGVDIGSSYDLANASYDNVSFSVSGQDTTPQDLFFKPDGAKMYVLGNTGNDVNEYTLSTAWDITTASYVQNFGVASQETAPAGLFFKPDGTKMYVVGDSSNAVNEYTLSSAWDISSASYVQSFSVSTQETDPTDVFFKPDGTKMYVAGDSANAVNEYSLSTAWDISTSSYDQSFNISSQTTKPEGLFFKPDGTKMYVIYINSLAVLQYSTGTIDIATFTYPASVDWPTNGVPPIAPAVGETDVLTFYTGDGGTTYNGFQAGDAMQ